MNVLQRKMFKNPNGRNARDKLKGMGGIMSSSPELANMVQGYSDGDQIRLPGENYDPKEVALAEYLKNLPPALRKGLANSEPIFNANNEIVGFGPKSMRGQQVGGTRQPEFIADPSVPAFGMSGKLTVPAGGIATRIRAGELQTMQEAIAEYNEKHGTMPLIADLDFGVGTSDFSDFARDLAELSTEFATVPLLLSAKGNLLLLESLRPYGDDFVESVMTGETKASDVPDDLAEVLRNRVIEGFGEEEVFSGQEFLSPGKIIQVTDTEREDADVVGRYDQEGFKRTPSEELLIQTSAKGFPAEDSDIQEMIRKIQEEGTPSGEVPKDGELLRRGERDSKLKFLQGEINKDKKEALEAPEVTEVSKEVTEVSKEGGAAPEVEMGGTAEAATTAITDPLPNEVFGSTHEEKVSSVQGLMNEFVSNAPEFKGLDKGMAIAKIGFAMAAGQSPNALTNIANAFAMGADMFIEDKKERDAFNRQVQLAGLKYGLEEASQLKREDRVPFQFHATKDGIGEGGRPFKKGDVVSISTGYMRENGVPSGLTTENMVLATNELAEAAIKAAADAAAANVIKDTDLDIYRKDVNDAAQSFEKSRNLEVLLKDAIFMVADGKVTGISNRANDLFARSAQLAGVDLEELGLLSEGTDLASIQKYNSYMTDISNSLIQEILQEGSKNLSNVDRQLAQEIVGLYHSWWKLATTDEDVIVGKLQRTYEKLKSNQKVQIDIITDALNGVSGRTFASGKPVTFTAIDRLLASEPQYQKVIGRGADQEGVAVPGLELIDDPDNPGTLIFKGV